MPEPGDESPSRDEVAGKVLSEVSQTLESQGRVNARADAEDANSEEDREQEKEPTDEHNEAPALEVYRSLPRKERRKVMLICLFVALHAGTVLVKGLKPQIRDHLWPAFSWYGDGLRMATTWGMFGAKHTNESVFSVGIDAAGARHELYPRWRGGSDAMERLLDARMRKIQSNLKKEKNHDSWGAAYAKYWCKHPPRGFALSHVLIETADDVDEELFPRKVIVKTSCVGSEGGS